MGRLILDLNKAHASRQLGDLTVVFTWCDDERAMVLIPTFRKQTAWYILKESAAYKYDNMKYLASQSKVAAEVLGMEPSPNNWYKLARVIHEHLPDLVTMPSAPDPTLMRASIGEMQLLEAGKLLGGQEIRLEEESGVAYGC